MGDRANFGFTADTGKPTLFLYAHNGGYEMLNTFALALDHALPRRNDDGYATRMAISHIVGDRWNGEYGYGLYIDSTGDNEHSVPVVNWGTQTVSLYPYFIGAFGPAQTPKFTMPIEAFIRKFAKHPSLV